jgi:hypothetical protein
MWQNPHVGETLLKLKALSLISYGIYSLSTRERNKTWGMSKIAVSEIAEDLKWRWKGYPDVWIEMKREERQRRREYEREVRRWENRKKEEAKRRREEEEEKKGKNKGEEEEEWEKLEELKKMDILREGWWYPPKE